MSDVKVVVNGISDPEPDEAEVEFNSKGACFDRMTLEEQAAVVAAVGSVEKVRANPGLTDC